MQSKVMSTNFHGLETNNQKVLQQSHAPTDLPLFSFLYLQSVAGKRPVQPPVPGTQNGTASVKSEEGEDKPMSREQMEELADGLGRLDEKALSGSVHKSQQAFIIPAWISVKQMGCAFVQM